MSLNPLKTRPRLILLASAAMLVTLLTGCEAPPRPINSAEKPVEFKPYVTTERAEEAEAILVKFRANVGGEMRARALSTAGLTSRGTFSLVTGLTIAEPVAGQTIEETLIALASDPAIAYAEPDFILTQSITPNDPDFSRQYGLANNGTGGISASAAWDIQTGTDIVVAVIDSGVDYNHEDLASNIWSNVDEIPNNGIDDDRNGYVDDIRGWDFNSNDNNPMDDNNHGTHVAGIIGARTNNGTGIAGINWNVKIMPLKFMNSRGSGRTSSAIRALEYAVANGAKVSNNSWGGGPFSQALYDAIQAANAAGHLFVAAAGNSSANIDTAPDYPAAFDLPNIISVAATDENDQLASFSNFGSRFVDLAAPGVNILSTIRNNRYSQLSGTSMAAPFVTGAAALVIAQNPTLSANAIKALLLDNVDPVGTLSSRVGSGGRLNLASAVTATPNTTPDPVNNPPPVTAPTVPTNPGTPVTPVDPPVTTPVIEPVVLEVTILPNVLEVAIGASAQLTASGGTPPYTWTVDNPIYAMIDSNTGVITGMTEGKILVVATDSVGMASPALEIILTPMSVLPNNISTIGLSDTITLNANGGVGPYVWNVSDPSVASIITSGVDNRNIEITPLSTGSFEITLSDTTGNIATSNLIQVLIAPLAVTPSQTTLAINETTQLQLSGGTSPYALSSSNNAVAVVDTGGLVTAVGPGTAVITITDFENSVQTVTINVTANLTPSQSTVVLGVSASSTVVVTGGDGNYQWSSSNPAIASVDFNGRITGISAGAAIITVIDGVGTTVEIPVEIRQVTVSIPNVSVTSNSPPIQLTPSGGAAPYTWTIDNPALASITNTGLFSPFSAGVVLITATDVDGISGSLSITIANAATNPTPAPSPAPPGNTNPVPAPAPTPAPAPATTGMHH